MFNDSKQQILEQLAEGEFCSGQSLGETLGISRAAVGKHIKALQQLGLDIYSVTGKGYRLANPLSLLSKERILADIPGPTPTLDVCPVIDSTNDYIRQQLHQGLAPGAAVLAEAQTAGRGRRGRQWVSPFGASLYLSAYWRFEQGMAATMGLSLAVGIAVAEALESLGVSDLGLKWPNDIYYQQRKLAGILIELEGQGNGACDLIIGLGINVVLPESVTADIDQPWADLTQALGPVDRNVLASRVLQGLWELLSDYEQQGFGAYVDRWNRLDCFMDQQVKLLMGDRQVTGIAKGVDHQGGLILATAEGEQHYYGGEISLRRT